MAAGRSLPFVFFSCPVLNTAASVVQTAGVLAFLLSCLEHRCAGSSDCGGVLEYIEPMYRGPSRGTCIGSIYTHPSRVGGIQAIILSYPLSYIYQMLL